MTPKVVLVTGSSRGIGRETARLFAADGWQVILNGGHRPEELNAAKEELSQLAGQVTAFFGDLGEYRVCESLFAGIEKTYGRLDVLINNAGASHIGLLQDMSPEEWHDLMRIDLDAVFYCSRLAIPLMLRQKRGKILNVSSVWGCVGASCEAAYSAAKGGVNALTRALAKELAPSGIQVNAVACGAVDTEMNAFLDEEDLLQLTDQIPAGRLGRPAEAAAFLRQLADAPDYLTGQVIRLDGGWI